MALLGPGMTLREEGQRKADLRRTGIIFECCYKTGVVTKFVHKRVLLHR